MEEGAFPANGAARADQTHRNRQHQQQQQLRGGQQLQQLQPQQHTAKALQPRKRGGGKRKSRWLKTKAAAMRDVGGGDGFSRMRHQNAMGSRQHFGSAAEQSWSTPRTAPRAPDNDNSYILEQHQHRLSGSHRNSPAFPSSAAAGSNSAQWTPTTDATHRGQDGAAGSGLDFFGTNEGLVAGYSSAEGTSGDADSSEPGGGPGSCGGGGGGGGGGGFAGGGLPQHIRARLESQSKYIAQLEEQNLDLQEKYSLLQHELENLRRLEADGARPVERGDTPVPPADAAG